MSLIIRTKFKSCSLFSGIFSEVKIDFKIDVTASLKGIGHAILGNFSTDQMAVELLK